MAFYFLAFAYVVVGSNLAFDNLQDLLRASFNMTIVIEREKFQFHLQI